MASSENESKTSVELPGQGSPFGELIKELSDKDVVGAEAHEISRGVFDEVQEATGVDVRELAANHTIEELADTRKAQILLLAAGFAGGRILLKKGVSPDYYRGHSASAYTAAGLAGALALNTAAKLLQKRGGLMHEAARKHPGGVAVTDLNMEKLIEICHNAGVYIANYNSPLQTMISGETDMLANAKYLIKQAGARATVLRNWRNGPVHSPLFQDEENQLRLLLGVEEMVDPVVPFVKNTDGKITESAEEIREDLGGMAKPVNWADSTMTLIANGVNHFIEVSPRGKRVLTGFLEDHGLKDRAMLSHLFDFL
jgi:[acyl-carrier-protein] S-malonyltransferase